MEVFRKLGEEIENSWRDQNYSEELFPALAADALKHADLPSKVDAWDVIEWTLEQNELPRQKDVYAKFGNPPITLFTAPRFYIDIYFWLDGTTQIHQHSFCGAFQVLLGSSIHSWYGFERHEAINAFTEIGEMNLKLCELLEVGAVQEIRAGRQYIHSLFHLDQPSATVVVRTEKSPLFLPQFSYHKPFVAVDPFFEHETTIKKLQSIAAMIRVNHPETDRLVSQLLEKSDFQTTHQILSSVRGLLNASQLNELFNLEKSSLRFESFMDIARRRHGEKVDVLSKVFAYADMQNEIVRRRSYVTDAEHRFFFALLMNVDGRERIFSLIKQRFADAEPLNKVLDWTFDLARTRVMGGSNALGIAEFDDTDIIVLEGLLKDQNRDEIASEFSGPNADSNLASLDARIAKIRDAVIFKPLFMDLN